MKNITLKTNRYFNILTTSDNLTRLPKCAYV